MVFPYWNVTCRLYKNRFGKWNQDTIPARWKSNVPSAWLHESDYAELIHARPQAHEAADHVFSCTQAYLLQPCVAVETCACSVSATCWSSWSNCGNFTQASCILPHALRTCLSHSTVVHFIKKRYGPVLVPSHCPVVQDNPQVIWNRYVASVRRAAICLCYSPLPNFRPMHVRECLRKIIGHYTPK